MTKLQSASTQYNMRVSTCSLCLWSEFDPLMVVVVSYVPVKLSPDCLPISQRTHFQPSCLTRRFRQKEGLADICKHQYIISGYWLIRDIEPFLILLINGLAMDSSAVPCSERTRILRIDGRTRTRILGIQGRTDWPGFFWWKRMAAEAAVENRPAGKNVKPSPDQGQARKGIFH